MRLTPNAPQRDNGGCRFAVAGCTDVFAFNFDPLAVTDDGSCVPFIYGCTDSNALTYNSTANSNNPDLCGYIGCTEPRATNYNSRVRNLSFLAAVGSVRACLVVPSCFPESCCSPFQLSTSRRVRRFFLPLSHTSELLPSELLPRHACTHTHSDALPALPGHPER
eukprot:1786792-Pleurochrysis_carterae.AAC.1